MSWNEPNDETTETPKVVDPTTYVTVNDFPEPKNWPSEVLTWGAVIAIFAIAGILITAFGKWVL